jgi:quinoprotein glucose dehydrogenase
MGRLSPLLVPAVFLFPFALLCRPASEGVYTKQQAARGQALYAEECAKCHGENLSGGDDSPELAGAAFMSRWKGKKLSALFTVINKTMPTDDPGHLSTRQSADLTAFILSSNGFPAGPNELPNNVAALNDIAIEAQK